MTDTFLNKKMFINLKSLFLISTLFWFFAIGNSYCQVKIVSWNIANLGKSKSVSEIQFIAQTLKDFDVIAIQEVVAGSGGSQAVAQLADELNRKGSKWDYTISNPTSSLSKKSERYAFLWKTSIVKQIGDAWLEQRYAAKIEREPFYCTFEYKNKQFTISNFHAITKNSQPEKEIKYFKFLPELYPNSNLIFLGDFNCPQSHTVFNPLKKMGYFPLLIGQKTTLKMKPKNNENLASEFDNIFYSSKITKIDGGIVLFYKSFSNLKEARLVSDHLPVWMEFSLN